MRPVSFGGTVLTLLGGLTLFGLSGCGGDGDDGPTDPIPTSTVRVELTDAPGNLASAWVDISQIVLRGTGGQTLLRDAPNGQLFDLAALDGQTVEIADKGGVVNGTYGQIRFVIDQAVIKTEAGEVFTRNGATDPDGAPRTGELTCDTCNIAPQGLPAFIGGDGIVLEGEETVTLVLDFDAFRSFTRTAEGWNMEPVASVAVKSEAVTVSGTVELPPMTPVPSSCGGTSTIEAFMPLLVDADNDRASWTGRVGSDGTYEIDFVPPGNYEVTNVESVEFEDEVLTVSASSSATTGVLQIEPGQDANLDFTISGASCDPLSGG